MLTFTRYVWHADLAQPLYFQVVVRILCFPVAIENWLLLTAHTYRERGSERTIERERERESDADTDIQIRPHAHAQPQPQPQTLTQTIGM